MSLSLAAVLAEPAWRTPDKTAVIQGARRRTYAQLWREALEWGAQLRDAGVRPGDRVALLAPNVIDFPRVYFGILAAGAVVVPIHLLLTPEEIAYILKDSGARLLIGHAARAQEAARAGELADVPVRITGAEDDEGAGPRGTVEPLHSYVSRAPEDPAVVIYTSGTTGRPKGAVLTHLNLVMNTMVNAFDCNDTRREDVALGCLPLFHIFGQTVSMNTVFRVGATLVLQPRFAPGEAIDLMNEHGVNTFHGVPQMYLALVQEAKARAGSGTGGSGTGGSGTGGSGTGGSGTGGSGTGTALPRLKTAISGGASLPAAVLEQFETVFDARIMEGYGLSETSPTATVNQPQLGPRPGTVGHAVWGVEVEIADATDEGRIALLPRGELGEIVVRGHNVFAGYLGQPQATAEAIVDGWFRTGDLGTKDADGYVTIVDRKKDLVIRGGFNVYPREVEEALLRHPAIAQAAVIGVPDPVHGEEVCACVILEQGAEASAEELVAWASERLGRHKYPRRIEFRAQFPLGPSMKVLKRELREQIARQDAE